jgi:phosphoribosylformimino-5-aminoimidazole carboxamide ribonucleotide (ProFAR) isomerase
MTRRKITTWAKISQVGREHFSEDFETTAITAIEATEITDEGVMSWPVEAIVNIKYMHSGRCT